MPATGRGKTVSDKTLKIAVSTALEERLKSLAERLDKTVDQVLADALAEYADTWEDHLKTVDALKEGDDRIQLAVVNES